MTKPFSLPFAALIVLALAACGERAEPPAIPNPDAGAPPAEEAEGMATAGEDAEEPPSPAESQLTREEIERQARETFETIVEQTEQASESLSASSTDIMQTITAELEAAGDSLDDQLAAIQRGVVSLRDDNLTLPEKLEIVANARTVAEEAARALGRPQEEVAAAGSQAEAAAREALDL